MAAPVSAPAHGAVSDALSMLCWYASSSSAATCCGAGGPSSTPLRGINRFASMQGELHAAQKT